MAAACLLALIVPLTHAAAPPEVYEALKRSLGAERRALQAAWRLSPDGEAQAAVLAEARAVVFDALVHGLIPAWEGTPWDFNGTSEVPGEGLIACGYFVSTILRDAGFNVERYRLAQQAAERIVLTLATPEGTWRSRGASAAGALRLLPAADALYVVGLDCHVGFLVAEGGAFRWCDASYVDPVAVACQDPPEAASFRSHYRVMGDVLHDDLLRAWLTDRPIRTRTIVP